MILLQFILLVFASPLLRGSEVDQWCDTTPHPQPCRIFMARYNPRHRAEFRDMAIQVALARATHALETAQGLEPQCHSKRTKAVWLDCLNLFRDMVAQLNRTSIGHCNALDAQTWLSAALTNLETCRSGSSDLNVTRFASAMLSNNVSELISNTLAINGATIKNEEAAEGVNEFPDWMTVKERKMLQDASLASKANVVVAKDGSGRFSTVQSGINYAVSSRRGNERVIVYVKRGVYQENVEIASSMGQITLVGDGLKYTIITASRSVKGGFTTYSSATFGVSAPGFIARGVTFRNTAGPQKGQAVALRSSSDLSVIYSCGVEGYQDTLFVLAQRQFFKSCYIYGTIDFIFGNAAAVFQNCIIYARRPLSGQANVITAQGRGDPFQNTGISIQRSQVIAAPDLARVVNSVSTYLGRPWQKYSRTVFLKCYLGSLVNPVGYMPWDNSNFGQDTLYYGEYRNFGPGSSTTKRVNWKGYHVITSSGVASQFTVANMITGQSWLPTTGIPFITGL
ncbi:probable pectinesterase/pectinesterase inhibitor 60 [Impatiens glandulifera]|uniref:probable pectinesterase/pectinesterase inhibitor 60 n=1 Tax=Impatiens glandulifera TaxID=253017 RepID=UPI001FB0FA47|nr:probable pectinesterase/pectinesterase inhibitor 60 [Impatiens glandulifera]